MKKGRLNNLKNLALKNPGVIYYLVTFLISWGGLVLILGGADQITAQPTNKPFLPLYLITIAGSCMTDSTKAGGQSKQVFLLIKKIQRQNNE